MSLRVADTLEVRRWILGYGPEAEVTEPAVLREALRQDADTLAHKLRPTRRTPSKVRGPSAARLRLGAGVEYEERGQS